MTISTSFDAFYARFAGKQLKPSDIPHAGVQRAARQSAQSVSADELISGQAEYRQFFEKLSSWYGAPGSSSGELKTASDGALMRAVDAAAKAAQPERPAASRPTLRLGAEGKDVKSMQAFLALRGFPPGPQDGIFGPRTLAAVRSFQKARGLVVDGVAGPQTWGALLRASSNPASGQTATPPAGDTRSTQGAQPTRDATPRTGGTAARLASHFGSSAGYEQVRRGVRTFYPADRTNGCVAYMSEALRQAGIPVPLRNDRSGENISLVTKPFSNYLEKELGFQRVSNINDLRPGDVGFTTDDPNWRGYPAHTFMFEGWQDKNRGIAWVVDNQGARHVRDLNQDDYGNYNWTPFAYALRP